MYHMYIRVIAARVLPVYFWQYDTGWCMHTNTVCPGVISTKTLFLVVRRMISSRLDRLE